MGIFKGLFKGNKNKVGDKSLSIGGITAQRRADSKNKTKDTPEVGTNKNDSIIGFEGKYKTLAKDYRVPVFDGIMYKCTQSSLEAKTYKEMSKRVPDDNGKRPDLPPIDEVVNKSLAEVTRKKFLENEALFNNLYYTKDKYINDTTVDNVYGKILMEIREEVKQIKESKDED